MSVDPDSSVPRPDPGHGHTLREKLPIPPVKRRHKKDDEGDQHSPGLTGGDGEFIEDDPLMAEIDELSARVQALKLKRVSTQRVVQANRGAKYHRLSRRQSPVASAPHDPADPASPAASPVTLPAPLPFRYAPWQDKTWQPGWLLGTTGVLIVGVLAFFLGQASIVQPLPPSRVAARPAAEPEWTADQIGQLDSLFAADRAGNPDTAYRQAVELGGRLGAREGLVLYTALLQARAGGLNNAEGDLARMERTTNPPLLNAAVQDRLGFIFARRRDFRTAAGSFSAAAAANPFDPLIFYHWGESLRRAGQLVEAMGKFQLALQRLPMEQPESYSARECAGLRLRLTQIELGTDNDLQPILEAQMRQPAPGVYWLLTQVAYCLQHDDARGASAALDRALASTPAVLLEQLANDYYLRQLCARRPEMTVLAPELTPARRARLDASMAYFIDP